MNRGSAGNGRDPTADGAGRPSESKAIAAVLAAISLSAFAMALNGLSVQQSATFTFSCAVEIHRALPLADALLGMLLGLASFALYRNKPHALIFAVPGGTMLWCRAAQDALFHFEQTNFGGPVRSGLLFEFGVDLISLVLGVATVAWIWLRWRIPYAICEGAPDADATRPAPLTALAIVLLLAAVGITAAWIAWFTTGRAALASQHCLVAFADSLFLAEELVALVAAVGGIGILRGRSWGFLWSLTTSGGLAFVASVEALFFAQHLSPDTPQAGLGPTLILLLTVTSLVAAIAPWRYRGWLLTDRGLARKGA